MKTYYANLRELNKQQSHQYKAYMEWLNKNKKSPLSRKKHDELCGK